MIGMSGLITPSLDEMVHNAKEMTRQGFTIPLLIGGATTSKAHTAVKISPGYEEPVVHVLDASLAVNVVRKLLSEENKPGFVAEVRQQQAQARKAYEGKQSKKVLVPIEKARKKKLDIDWSASELPQPSFTGTKVLENIPLEQLVPFIDWTPFFQTWELKGRYPKIFDDPILGEKAKELFDDAQALLKNIVDNKLLTARAVYGFFPANSVGDDIQVYRDDSRTEVLSTVHTLRQQLEKVAGQSNMALADFIAPQSSGKADYMGGFAVTAGLGVDAVCKKFELDHDDYNSIMTKALADRFAEALAEWLHQEARREWGYGKDEQFSNDDLISEKYRGIRPAPGYPACPDHTEKRILFDLLGAEKATGIELTETYAMFPAASVSGFYFGHERAKYFGVGKINRDQVEDYAKRKNMDLPTVERWLSPNLSYDP